MVKVEGTVSSSVFGPVDSRRLGFSLGINLLPANLKVCSFNCPYCECGWTRKLIGSIKSEDIPYPARKQVYSETEQVLKKHLDTEPVIDNITLAGNGEPTLHPEFPGIIDDLLELRGKYAPQAGLVILSNAAHLDNPKIVAALNKMDERFMKLDAGDSETFSAFNRPAKGITLDKIINGMKNLDDLIIQSLFSCGSIDNTSPEQVDAWIAAVKRVIPRPKEVQVYTSERAPADPGVQPAARSRLEAIAKQLSAETGLKTSVFV
jgi:wyosine [tRNA(Phe)-imidazoG37] synthetase (radical SAM superfamily)